MKNAIKPSLLTNSELEWLVGNKQVSKSFEYKIKSTIKKKIDKFLNFELPLLIQNEILDKELIKNIIGNPNNMLPILGKEKVAGPKVWKHAGIPAQGYIFRRVNNVYR
jgi:hypothetical protein